MPSSSTTSTTTPAFAAQLLLDTDPEFVSKRLSDAQILTLLDLYTDPTPTSNTFATELLTSPRTDTVCKRAAAILYSLANEPLPEPYDHTLALQRFSPTPPIIQTKAAFQTPPPPSTPQKKLHTVQPGDNLWKIARKYHVSVDELMRTNRLDTSASAPASSSKSLRKLRSERNESFGKRAIAFSRNDMSSFADIFSLCQNILATLESYREFQFQRFNFSFVEADHVPAHGRWK